MSKYFGLYLFLFVMICLNLIISISARTIIVDKQNPKQFNTALSEHLDFIPDYFVVHPQSDVDAENEDNDDHDVDNYEKRSLRMKLANIFARSEPKYTIAFPSLLRSRRSTIKKNNI
ncbi:unnamed protein product [Adineta ricciae]|uniref:Uncharacterized protein n=1 Tax=Adineta ricciae TaxID=249248 RepID=A0A815ZUY2_ADIRI|nr:unnamed protein product [Adineta ricciae]CAF1587152.1 unnamed protein product [Adineta ricciae]